MRTHFIKKHSFAFTIFSFVFFLAFLHFFFHIIIDNMGLQDIRRKFQVPFQSPSQNSNTTQPEGNQVNGYRSCIYYSNWSVYARKHFPSDIPVNYVTNIFYAFIGVDNNSGKLKFSDEWADLQLPMLSVSPNTPNVKVEGLISQLYQLKKYNRHLKVSMSIGGWGTEGNFKSIVSDQGKLHSFVASCLNFLKQYGFDGIDLDWEYPENESEATSYVLILKLLRMELSKFESEKGLTNGSLLLTIAAPAGKEHASKLHLREMDQYLSFWNLMLYDFAGSWSSKTAYQSNLFGGEMSCDDSIQYYLKAGIPSNKLVMGMPNYGRGFANTENGTDKSFSGVGSGSSDEAGIWNYKYLPPDGYKEFFDYQKVSAYCYSSKERTFISYDNYHSARIKAKYVESHNLGGGMWWESCGDNYDDPERSIMINFVQQLGQEKLDKSPNELYCYDESDYLKKVIDT